MKEFVSFWKRGFDFAGVSSRREYWMAALFNLLFGWLPAAVFFSIGLNMENYFIALFYGIAYTILTAIPSLAILVRRLHDSNKSAWFLLLSLIPYIGSLVLFVFTLLDSDHKNNFYIYESK